MHSRSLKPTPFYQVRDLHSRSPLPGKQGQALGEPATGPLINPRPPSHLPPGRALPAAGALGSAPLESPPTSGSAWPARVRARTFVRRFESPPLRGSSPTSGSTSAAVRASRAGCAGPGRPAPSARRPLAEQVLALPRALRPRPPPLELSALGLPRRAGSARGSGAHGQAACGRAADVPRALEAASALRLPRRAAAAAALDPAAGGLPSRAARRRPGAAPKAQNRRGGHD